MTADTSTLTFLTPSASLGGRAIGAMFFTVFGGMWLMLWANSEFNGSVAVFLAILAATGALFYRAYMTYKFHAPALRHAQDLPESRRKKRLLNLVNLGQWVVIVAVAGLLSLSGRETFILPAVIFIIGTHFIPLARLFNYLPHYVTGSGMMLLAVSYPLFARDGPTSDIGALGAGLILWLSAIWAITRHSHSSAATNRA